MRIPPQHHPRSGHAAFTYLVPLHSLLLVLLQTWQSCQPPWLLCLHGTPGVPPDELGPHAKHSGAALHTPVLNGQHIFELKSLFMCKNMVWAIQLLPITACFKPFQCASIICMCLELQGGNAAINQHVISCPHCVELLVGGEGGECHLFLCMHPHV